MRTKKTLLVKPAAAPGLVPPPPDADELLVCLQDPFDAVGDSSTIVRAMVPAADHDAAHLWQLEAVLEMNAPRVFAGWATRGGFTLDLSVHATAAPACGLQQAVRAQLVNHLG